jgi:hypothetical protein
LTSGGRIDCTYGKAVDKLRVQKVTILSINSFFLEHPLRRIPRLSAQQEFNIAYRRRIAPDPFPMLQMSFCSLNIVPTTFRLQRGAVARRAFGKINHHFTGRIERSRRELPCAVSILGFREAKSVEDGFVKKEYGSRWCYNIEI